MQISVSSDIKQLKSWMAMITSKQRASLQTALKVIRTAARTWGISTEGHILYIAGVIQLLLFMRGEKKKAQVCYGKKCSAGILRNHSGARVRVVMCGITRRLHARLNVRSRESSPHTPIQTDKRNIFFWRQIKGSRRCLHKTELWWAMV